MADLTRNLFIPYIDANKVRQALGIETEGDGFDFTQIDKSTIFDLAFNPQETTSGFIDEANDTTYVDSYQPELPQEIILDNTNPLFKIMFPFCMKMPTGSDAEVPVLLRTPNLDTAEPTDAYLWEKALVSPTDLNTVDKKLNFSLKLNGGYTKGTVNTSGGKVTFIADDGTQSTPVEGEEVQTLSARSTKSTKASASE